VSSVLVHWRRWDTDTGPILDTSLHPNVSNATNTLEPILTLIRVAF